MPQPQRVKLFRSGRTQAVRIPREFELPGEEALLRQEGNALVLQPLGKPSLIEALKTLTPIDDIFPDVDEGLLPPRDIEL